MRHIKYHLEIGYCGCDEEGVMPVEDSLTDDNIDEIVDSMAHEHAQAWEGDERLCWDSDMSDEEYIEATEHFYDNVSGSWHWATDEEKEDYGVS